MRKLLAIITGFAALLTSVANAEIKAVWSTDFALPGEKAVLVIQQEHKSPNSATRMQQVTPGKLTNGRFLQNHEYFEESLQNITGNPNGRIEVFMRLVEVGGSGKVECEDIEVTLSDGRTEKVSVPDLPVYTTAKVEWRTIEGNAGSTGEDGNPSSFGTMWITSPEEYYDGQPVHASLKLLLPSNFNRFEQKPQVVSKGVQAEDFRYPLGSVLSQFVQHMYPKRQNTARARGQEWIVMDLEVNLIPQDTGNNEEGNYDVYVNIPSLFQIQETRQENTGNFFFSSSTIRSVSKTLKLPKLKLPTPRPLPPNPPADFSDLVGNYSIETSTDAQDLAMNEMIDVQITVKGTGSLEQLTCPQLQEAENWKLMPATRKVIYSVTGDPEAVVFSQLMRPIVEVSGVPAFSFSYFDDKSEEYKTAESKPIGLPWKATDAAGTGQVTTATAAPPAGTVPVAELTDIYQFMPDEGAGGNGPAATYPRALWYLLYLPGFGILLWMLGRYGYNKWQTNTAVRQRNKALNALASQQDTVLFLKSIGAFIESNIPASAHTPELQNILDKRDAEVFRPDAHPMLGTEERNRMLKTVRKALSGIAAMLIMLLSLTQLCYAAGDTAMQYYEDGQYSKALETLNAELENYTNGSTRDRADLLYNIGNCQYRLNEPGVAALYYARALQENPGMAEAEANLAFIQRKEGAVLPQKKGADEVFTYLSYQELWLATVICTAVLLLSIALSLLLKEKLKLTLRTVTGISLFLSLLCGADYIYYNTRTVTDLTATPPANLAYVTKATTARSAALDTAASVIDLPASTPVRLIATRGNHRYVETFTGERGWIPADTATALDPEGKTDTPLIIRFK